MNEEGAQMLKSRQEEARMVVPRWEVQLSPPLKKRREMGPPRALPWELEERGSGE